jgi:hypothetical protein
MNSPRTPVDAFDPRPGLQHRAAQLYDEIAQGQRMRAAVGDDTAHDVMDLKDRASARAPDGVADSEVERDERELAQVEAALLRLADTTSRALQRLRRTHRGPAPAHPACRGALPSRCRASGMTLAPGPDPARRVLP